MAAGIGEGAFPARPKDAICRYCRYEPACVTDRERSFGRKKHDPAMSGYFPAVQGFDAVDGPDGEGEGDD
jgi:hypothetical protein